MSMLLEIGRQALEGIEVLTAFATTGLLLIGLHYSRHAQPHDDAPRPAPDGSR